MMNLLFVSLDPYPESGACTNLMKKLFFEGKLMHNNNIHVLTIHNNFVGEEFEENEGVQSHRIYACSLITIKQIKKNLRKHCCAAVSFAVQKIIDKAIRKLNPSLFYSVMDYKSIKKALNKILETYDIDAIVAIAGYFSTVKAIMELKNFNGKCIVYMVDPCSTNKTLNPQYIAYRRRFERHMIASIDLLITTPLVFEELKRREDIDINKIVKMEFPNVSPHENCNSKVMHADIRCMYIGRLYAGRNPDYLFQLFSLINREDVSLYFVGVSEEETDSIFKPDNAVFTGMLPISELKEYYENADFFINLGNGMTNQVPSKLFDYISYGKPIINICKNKDCPTLIYLDRYPYALSIIENCNNVEQDAEKVSEFIDNKFGCICPKKEIERLYHTSTPEYCASVLKKCIYDNSEKK